MEYEFRGPGVQKKPQKRRERSRAKNPERPLRAAGGTSRSRSLVQLFAAVVGAVFLLGGILGFIPGATTDYDQLSLIGPDSQAKLLGLFEVSVVRNIVHLAFGVAGLLAATRASASVGFLVGGGILYAVVFVYGILVEQGSDLDLLPVNDADNILHLGLSLGMILLGVIGAALLRREPARA
ncbi:hypothetical protein BH24ACT1_BH24ACT1_00370 [soil metagenome]